MSANLQSGFGSASYNPVSKNTPMVSHDISRISCRPQARLTVSQPGDFYEQQADQVAQEVMSMGDRLNNPTVQRESSLQEEEENLQSQDQHHTITPLVQREEIPQEEEQEELVQAKSSLQRFDDGGLAASNDIANKLHSRQGQGTPLADDVRNFMEPRFGVDFSDVKVHADNEAVNIARELNAQALTYGNDIYFGAGKSPGNNELTAHELTHVVQQTGRITQQPNSDLQKQNQPVQIKVSSQPIATRTLMRAHLKIEESVEQYSDQINPTSGAAPITQGGQFYWSDRLELALGKSFSVSAPLIENYYKSYCNSLSPYPVGTGILMKDLIEMRDAIFNYRDGVYFALHKQIKEFTIKSKDKDKPEVKNFASILAPASTTGKELYKKCWSTYFQTGSVFDFSASQNKKYLTFSMLFALHHEKEQGACGETAGMLADFFVGKKKGFSGKNPSMKRSPANKWSQNIFIRSERKPFPLGDVNICVSLGSVIAKMQKSLDDGIIFVARVSSGLYARDALGGDNFEHSITIIGYDANKFVFWDPDTGASEGAGGKAGFGLLYYDSANNRLTTAKDDADMKVNGVGNHSSHPAQHRYQVGSLIGK
jgi:hypothetical protein